MLLISVKLFATALRYDYSNSWQQRRRKVSLNYLMDENIGLGKETVFDFKYIPTLGRMTRAGKRKIYSIKRPGVELLSYLGLISAFWVALSFGASLYLLVGFYRSSVLAV